METDETTITQPKLKKYSNIRKKDLLGIKTKTNLNRLKESSELAFEKYHEHLVFHKTMWDVFCVTKPREIKICSRKAGLK